MALPTARVPPGVSVFDSLNYPLGVVPDPPWLLNDGQIISGENLWWQLPPGSRGSVCGGFSMARLPGEFPVDHWVAAQCIIPLDDQPGVFPAVRCNASGDGYYVSNVGYTEDNTLWLRLLRRNGVAETLLGSWSVGHDAGIFPGVTFWDGFHTLLEVSGTDPVSIRVSVIWATPGTVVALPGAVSLDINDAECFAVLGTVSDSSASRVVTGVPGMRATGTNSAGGLFGFNAGAYLSALSATVSNGSSLVSGTRSAGTAIAVNLTAGIFPSPLPVSVGVPAATGVASAGGVSITASVPISFDAGFPVSASKLNVSGLTIPNTPPLTFSTAGATRTLVACVSFYPPESDPYPITLEWSGGTPAGASVWAQQTYPEGTSGAVTTSLTGAHDGTIHWTSQIWTATATQQLTNVGVVATRRDPTLSGAPAGELVTGILSVYSIAGASGSVGARAQHHTPMSEVNGPNQAQTIPITATANGSAIIGLVQWGNLPDGGAFVPYDANTTIDYQAQDGGADGGAAAFHLTGTTTASTTYTLGTTSTQYAWTLSVIEILKAP